MDCHSFGCDLIAISVSDNTIDLTVVHLILHTVSICGRLIAGTLEYLCTELFDIPLISQAIALCIRGILEFFRPALLIERFIKYFIYVISFRGLQMRLFMIIF